MALGAARSSFDQIARIARLVGQGVLAFMVITICYDALMRYAFAAPTSWSLEVNSFLILYIAVMIAADVQRHDGHIRITFFIDTAGPGLRRLAAAITGLAGLGFCAIMAWRGFLLAYQAFEYGERVSSSFGTPMVLPYAVLPLGFGALALQFLFTLLDALSAKR